MTQPVATATTTIYQSRFATAQRRIATAIALGLGPDRHDVRQAERYRGLLAHVPAA
jgi:hypothetical protein